MNSLNFLQRLAPWLNTSDVSVLTATDRLGLLQAINTALIKWNDLIPVEHRKYPGSAMFSPGRAVTGITVTNASRTISGGGFTADDIGKQLVLEGDDVPHVLTSPTLLRLHYGGTSGTVNGTLYGDCFVLPENFDNMAGSVFIENATERRELPPLPDVRRKQFSLTSFAATYGLNYQGEPIGYGIETARTLGTNGPAPYMRIYPLPAKVERVSFDYYGPPREWTMTDLQTARELDIDDVHWVTMVPMTVREMLGTGLLKADVDANIIVASATGAEARIKGAPPTPGQIPITIGTVPGF